MILLLEQDTRKHGNKRFLWKPFWFKATWKGKKTWRIGWGLWSISCYPEPGIKEFFDYIRGNNTEWHKK
jgi:hypothetical protein